MWNVVLAQTDNAPTEPTGPPGGMSAFGSPMFMIVAFIVIMYVFMLRPTQRRERERREMLDSLSRDDRVVTSGGVCGTIVGLGEKTVVLRVSDDTNIKMEFLRSAISQVASRAGESD